ncbi:hypothetical protein ACLOJK_041545 [Asimina triloba]
MTNNNIPEEWAFLTSLEQHYGFSHPFFYACRFVEALKMAEEESKPLFIYLHLPDHPHTAPFCTQTLGSDLVVQFLDANFISWGAIANRGEGLHMTNALRVPNFPFCAIIMPLSTSAENNNVAVLQQVEGPVSPAQLVEILQRTIEEQGSAFRAARAADEERRVANRLLREEQDAAYHAALQLDREKERVKESAIDITGEAACQRGKMPKGSSPPAKQPTMKAKRTAGEAQRKETAASHGKDAAMVTQIQIRFPNGERKERSFLCTDKIQSIYRFIDSLDLPGMASYRLISNFPRKVYGLEQMGITLKDAGLHPRASLFIELV